MYSLLKSKRFIFEQMHETGSVARELIAVTHQYRRARKHNI